MRHQFYFDISDGEHVTRDDEGLMFADLGYVLVAGQVVIAATGDELLHDRSIGRLFLGE